MLVNLVSRFWLPDLFIHDIRLSVRFDSIIPSREETFFTGKLFRADWIFIQSFFPLYPPLSLSLSSFFLFFNGGNEIQRWNEYGRIHIFVNGAITFKMIDVK